MNTQPVRAGRTGGYRRLDDEPIRIEPAAGFLEIGVAASFNGEGRHGWDAAIRKLREICLVAAPPQKRWWIDHRPAFRLSTGEERQPPRVIEMIAPDDQGQDEIEGRQLACIRPHHGFDCRAGDLERTGLDVISPAPRLRVIRIGDENCDAHGLAAEQDPRLPGNLREHWRAHMAFCASASDKLPELIDAGLIIADPVLDGDVGVFGAAARQKVDPELLEIARETGGQQTLPLIGGHEPRYLLLCPVEAECFAEARVSSRYGKLVDSLAGRKRRNREHSVELEKAHEPANDVVARAERDQTITTGRRFVANLGADQLRRCCGDLAHAGLEQLAQNLDACLATACADDVRQVRANTRGSDREELNLDRLRQRLL